MKKLLLASKSPRRQALLQEMYIPFETVDISCDEIYPGTLRPDEVPAYLSALKSDAYGVLSGDEVLLTADTVVLLDDNILGKPRDQEDAVQMLLRLSGRTHRVYTAYTLRTATETMSRTDGAEIDFGIITPAEARFYAETCNPLDKAGSYGIQDWVGITKINAVRGSFYTVMGLPTHLLYEDLRNLGLTHPSIR